MRAHVVCIGVLGYAFYKGMILCKDPPLPATPHDRLTRTNVFNQWLDDMTDKIASYIR